MFSADSATAQWDRVKAAAQCVPRGNIMSNMPLIPVSSAPVASNTAPQSAASPIPVGGAVSVPGSATATPASASALPVNFAQALLELRSADLLGQGTPQNHSAGQLPLAGCGSAEAASLELVTSPAGREEILPLAGTCLPLSLPVGMPVGEGVTPEVAPLTAGDTLSLTQAERTDLFAYAGAFPVATTAQNMAAISLQAYDRPLVAGQGSDQLLSESMVRTQSAFQLNATQHDSTNGRPDALLSTLQSQAFLVGPQFAPGVNANVSAFAVNPLTDPSTMIFTDASMNSSHALPTPALNADPVAPRLTPSTWVTTISAPVATPDWDTALGEHVKFMAKNELNFAEIRVTPPQLGPVEVRLSVQQDQAQVTLFATNVATRDALEAALPKLRDMFADAGLNLAGANVASESFAEQRGRDGPARGTSDAALGAGSDQVVEEQSEVRTLAVRGGSALDVFA